MKRYEIERIVLGLAGAALIFLEGWRWHVAIGVWLSAILLVWSFRLADRWFQTLPILAATVLFRYLSIAGGWDVAAPLMLAFALLVLSPLWAALYVDRWFARSDRRPGALLMFPLVYTAGDFLLGFSPLGTVFSPAAGQFGLAALAQIASITGLWGITFLIGLTATTANHAREFGWDLRRAGRAVAVLLVIFALLLTYSYGKILLTRPESGTVLIAGVAEPHPSDYWAITDAGTPRASKAKYSAEMTTIIDHLFTQSRRAADYGAQIVVWSEGNAVMYEDDLDAFLGRASAFARDNHVYFAPTALVLRYDRTKNDNLAYMFGPDGKTLFRYEKTISWYPTDSDGVVPTVETPWGTLGVVICFDLDFPRLARQASDKGVDILLVPGFDTEAISPYHTQIGTLRGVEYGFSVFREANKGTSMAVDYSGNVLAYQDFFDTSDHVMFADVPVRGISTIYGSVGDAFIALVWLSLIGATGLTLVDVARRRASVRPVLAR